MSRREMFLLHCLFQEGKNLSEQSILDPRISAKRKKCFSLFKQRPALREGPRIISDENEFVFCVVKKVTESDKGH